MHQNKNQEIYVLTKDPLTIIYLKKISLIHKRMYKELSNARSER